MIELNNHNHNYYKTKNRFILFEKTSKSFKRSRSNDSFIGHNFSFRVTPLDSVYLRIRFQVTFKEKIYSNYIGFDINANKFTTLFKFPILTFNYRREEVLFSCKAFVEKYKNKILVICRNKNVKPTEVLVLYDEFLRGIKLLEKCLEVR